MTTNRQQIRELSRRSPSPLSTGCADIDALLFAEFCDTLFASFPRRDQRRKGVEYLRGLLATSGRKSARNMAMAIGGPGAEQSLHHFVGNSTWDWTEVRRSLAQYLLCTAPPEVWVARHMVIPKVGHRSVGVSRFFSPDDGQVMNAQRATGVWAVSGQLSVPLNWRLHLPQQWVTDGVRRRSAAIPPDLEVETPSEALVAACDELRPVWGMKPLPIIVNTGDTDDAAIIRRLRDKGMRPIVRVPASLPLRVVDPALTNFHGGLRPAGEIVRAALTRRRQVKWVEPYPDLTLRTSLVTTAQVDLGHSSTGLRLVEVSHGGQHPTELWLTATEAHTVPRLTWLASRVEQDFTEITERVGIRDYAGRSYTGWHRHVTLASAAHALLAVANAFRGPAVRAS